MIKRGTINSVLVEIEKLADDEFTLKSGVKLFMDTSYKPEQHQRIYGTCVAIPELLTKGDQIKYEEGDYRFVDSIVPEVKIGDKVYFTYISVNKTNLIEYEGKSYCNIPYSAILCVVRDVPDGYTIDVPLLFNYQTEKGLSFDEALLEVSELGKKGILPKELYRPNPAHQKIIPIGGNVMCEEYYGKDAEMIEVNGFKIHVESSKSSSLITNIVKKPSQKHAVIRIVGAPLKEDNINTEISYGDVVIFPDKFGFKNNIEGKDYLFLKYWDIHAIVGNETESAI